MTSNAFDTPLTRKLKAFLPLTSDELNWLAEIQVTPSVVERGKQLIQEGQNGHRVFVLQAGWTCGYKNLPNGGRQIISFPIAGDCVGLRSALLRTADHSFSALTDAVVSFVEREDIVKGVTQFPRVGAAILWAASREEAMVVDHLVNVKQRNAIERTAHFFLALAERLSLVGLATEAEFRCPLSKSLLTDALGLTDIHLNRVLRQLSDRKLLTLRRGRVHIHDLSELKKLAGFQGGYLNARDWQPTPEHRHPSPSAINRR
jgi:CRP-like cAMP-binding protein